MEAPIPRSTQVAICGAGIAGISAAYHLAVRRGVQEVLLFDERPPLSLTSDKSTECYRNWWPGPGDAMVRLMNRSIDLMEGLARETGNIFHLNRRGYLYLTGDPAQVPVMRQAAQAISHLGAGPLRIHLPGSDFPGYIPAALEGFEDQPEGADLILDRSLLSQHFPNLSEAVVAGLHVRRAGWFSAQQMGMYLLNQARLHGVRLIPQRVTGVDVRQGRVQAIRLQDGSRIQVESFVNAAGPLLQEVGGMVGEDLPIFSELHLKLAFKDHLGVLPRQAPLLIWNDPQKLPWSPEEHDFLAEDPENAWLLEQMPPGVHTRPEGGLDSPIALMLWEYRTQRMPPSWPIPLDPAYPDVVLRGLAKMLPGFQAYFNNPGRPLMDGGYYTRTQENRPLIGPMATHGAYVIGALSGFGLMSACAAGELLADHLTGAILPPYAPAFSLERYSDPRYLEMFSTVEDTGQL